jgi:hypothetical protein
MDERRTGDEGTNPPEDMPTQAYPPMQPADAASTETPGDTLPEGSTGSTGSTGSVPPGSTWSAPSSTDWVPPSSTESVPPSPTPPASWQQAPTSPPPATSAAPPPAYQPSPAYQPPPATTGAPPPATWQQAAPPAAAAATGWQQPPSQWVQPPQVGMAAGGATGLAKVGSIILILFGLLFALAGVVLTIGASAIRDALESQYPEFADALANVAAVIGIVILVVAILEIVTGIFAWRGAGWARVVGIIYGLFFGLVLLAGLVGPRATQPIANDGSNTLLTTAVAAIAYLYVAVVFIFRFRKSPGI